MDRSASKDQIASLTWTSCAAASSAASMASRRARRSALVVAVWPLMRATSSADSDELFSANALAPAHAQHRIAPLHA